MNRRAERLGHRMPVLLEVNVGEEASKSGWTPAGLLEDINQLAGLPNIEVRGLMTIPPPTPAPSEARPFFRALRQLRDRLAQEGYDGMSFDELSMGMTADYDVAIEEGATLVRVGTAIFGPRPEAPMMSGRETAIKDTRFAFLGGGNMAEALIKGLLTGLGVDARHIVATDIVSERCDHLRGTYGINTSEDNQQAVHDSEVIFLAVKPQTVPALLASIAPGVGEDKLFVSIAAGVPLSTLQHALPDDSRVVRVMPNTPALVLEGATGISPGAAASADDVALVERIFNAVGRATVVSDGHDGHSDRVERQRAGFRVCAY